MRQFSIQIVISGLGVEGLIWQLSPGEDQGEGATVTSHRGTEGLGPALPGVNINLRIFP